MTHHTVLACKNNIIAIACLKPVILNDIPLGTKLASGNSRSPSLLDSLRYTHLKWNAV
jgi:hypothetical protein